MPDDGRVRCGARSTLRVGQHGGHGCHGAALILIVYALTLAGLTVIQPASVNLLVDGSYLPLSISVGVAYLPERSEDLRGLHSAAGAALYDAARRPRPRGRRFRALHPPRAGRRGGA